MDKELAREYLTAIRNYAKNKVDVCIVLDYVFEFVEKNNLEDLFVKCNLNPLGLFAFARYRAGEITLDKLEYCILNIINKREVNHV